MRFSKKGQFSYVDLIISLVIFAILLTLFFKYSSNITDRQEGITGMVIEGRIISDNLISEGFPSNWNSSNVMTVGITDNNNQVNETKLQNLININYDETRNLLRTKYDYYFFFKDQNGSVIKINSTEEGIGYPGVNSSNIEYQDIDDLIKLERILFFKNHMAKMVLYVWQ